MHARRPFFDAGMDVLHAVCPFLFVGMDTLLAGCTFFLAGMDGLLAGRTFFETKKDAMHARRPVLFSVTVLSAFAVLVGGEVDHTVEELGHGLHGGESAKGGHRLV